MSYHLVQRCKEQGWKDPAYGFDGFFRCDYMGSAEFEFGAIPQSLKRIRATGDIARKYRAITIDGVTRKVWFVGSLATLKQRVDEFEDWAAKGFRGKELTYFRENFTGRDSWGSGPVSDYMAGTVLWWALNEDVFFALDEAVADTVLEAISTKATAR